MTSLLPIFMPKVITVLNLKPSNSELASLGGSQTEGYCATTFDYKQVWCKALEDMLKLLK